jgi:hypothetical protein
MLCIVLNTVTGQAQIKLEPSYVDKMLSHKITIHYTDHLVIATVNPVDVVSLESNYIYHWFSGNQINTTQGAYSGKLLNGLYEDFYLNKNLRESGNFLNGLKTSNWKSWTDNGILKDEYTYKQGAKSGPYTKYDLKGLVAEKGYYTADLLNGKQETVLTDSTIVVYYKDGKVIQRKSIIPNFIHKFLKKKPSSTQKP